MENKYAFPDVESVQLPKNLKSLQFCCSYYESLENVVIPTGVTWIGSAFFGCTSLQSVTIPNTVTAICHGTFLKCSSLSSIDIPKSVSVIGGPCTEDCTNEYDDQSLVFSPNTTVNFPEGINEAIEIPENKWGAGKITIEGVEYNK